MTRIPINPIPSHEMFATYAPEVGTITESSDGTTPATLPAIPGSAVVIGYADIPDTGGHGGAQYGFGAGSAEGLYPQRNPRTPRITLDIRVGGFALLAYCMREDGAALPELAITVGQRGVWSYVYRFCKCSELALSLAPDGDGGGGELRARATFEAITRQVGSPVTITAAAMRTLGTPLMFHDLRQVLIGGNDYKPKTAGLNLSINHSLERKTPRENWGDDSVLSLTSYALMEHQIRVTGDITTHGLLRATLADHDAMFHGSNTALEWGDLSFVVSDLPAVDSLGRTMTVTAASVLAGDDMQVGGPTTGQSMRRVPFSAANMTVDTEVDN